MTDLNVAFVDTETTGLHPEIHEIWECALIIGEVEWVWQLPVDLGRADPKALEIGHFHERRAQKWSSQLKRDDGVGVVSSRGGLTPLDQFATEFARITRGLHLVGAVVSFDAERLGRLLRAQGQLPEWHYHLIDVEALGVGYLSAMIASARRDTQWESSDVPRWHDEAAAVIAPPWKSDDLSRALGVVPGQFDKHTALGDARWARAMYEAVMGA